MCQEFNQGVAVDPANLHPSFCAIEKLIEDANVNMDSYGVLTSTDYCAEGVLKSVDQACTRWLSAHGS